MKIVTIEDNKNNIVKKHQDLVHNARYRLGDTAIKTLSLLISMIKVSDDKFHQYIIKLSDFKELTNADTNEVFKYVDRMTTDLMSKPFWVGNSKFNWVTIAKYKEGEGVVVFEIHQELKPYLLELKKNFLQYNITNILPLKSGYIIRLYEICKDHYNESIRYKESKKHVTFELEIDKIKETFEIPKSYLYKDIRVNIIDKAVTQFKAKTDIQISYTEQKLGRRVDRILITVEENNKGSNDHMKNLQKFIAYIRTNYTNKKIIESTDKYTSQQVLLSVSEAGKLYNKKTTTPIDPKRSQELWQSLYDMNKSGLINL